MKFDFRAFIDVFLHRPKEDNFLKSSNVRLKKCNFRPFAQKMLEYNCVIEIHVIYNTKYEQLDLKNLF